MNTGPRGGHEPPGTHAAPASAPVPGSVALDEAECRRLLATATVGRISFTHGALPAIVPVPFALHAGQVLVPAVDGSAMVSAVRGAIVAFGVDSFDPRTETGWGVTVVGPSWVLRDLHRLVGLTRDALPVVWTGPGRCLIAVQVGLLRGWRTVQDLTAARDGSAPVAW